MVSINKNRQIWLCIIILIYILSSYSVYMVIYEGYNTLIQLLVLFLSLISIFLFSKKKRINKKIFLVPICVMCVFVSSTIFSNNEMFNTLMHCLRFTTIYYVVACLSKKNIDILNVIYKCLFFLMVFYFLCYILFDIIYPSLGLSIIYDYQIDTNGVERVIKYLNHYNVYIRWDTSYNLFGIDVKRLSGFCWESGQYQIYLNYILIYLLFFSNDKRNRIKKIIFTCVNVVLTASTMGLIVMIIALAIKAHDIKNRNIRFLSFLPIIGLTLYLLMQLMIKKSTLSIYSYNSRLSEFNVISDIFTKNNIFGEKVFISNIANAVIRFMWNYGFIALISLLLIFVLIYLKNNYICTLKQSIIFSIWLLFSMFNEPIEYFNFTFLIYSIVIIGYLNNKTKGGLKWMK